MKNLKELLSKAEIDKINASSPFFNENCLQLPIGEIKVSEALQIAESLELSADQFILKIENRNIVKTKYKG